MRTLFTLSLDLTRVIVHVLVACFAIYILYEIHTNTYISRWDVYTNYIVIIAFYIHSLVSLPLITRRKKTKKYLISTLISFLIITYLLIWFEANESSEMVVSAGGTRYTPSYFFFQTQWLLYGLFTGILIAIPFSLFSLFYHILIINKEERKALFALKYTEAIFNCIVSFSLILFTFVNFDGRGTGIVNTFEIILLLVIFYLHTFVFYTKLFKRKNYVIYAVIIGITFAGYVVIKSLFQNDEIDQLVPFSSYIGSQFISFLITLLLSFVYAIVRSKLKANKRLFDLQLNAKESELQLLKSQVNPHFLFNTLNTLYAGALKENAPKSAQSIVKLASLIRYMQNDIHKDEILLQQEIDYLQDYIEIQKLRVAIEPEIKTSFIDVNQEKVSPGLLIPLIENAFKYGIQPDEKSRIEISIQCKNDLIYFRCKNNYNPDQKVHHMNEGFGIGIKNVKERLQLVYPNKHQFEIIKDDLTFTVELTIQIQ